MAPKVRIGKSDLRRIKYGEPGKAIGGVPRLSADLISGDQIGWWDRGICRGKGAAVVRTDMLQPLCLRGVTRIIGRGRVGVPERAAHPFFLLETTFMNETLRLLIPDKKGILKRIEAAVRTGGGQFQQSRLKRQMRGMSEAEIDITYESDLFLPPILSLLGAIPGVALLGAPSPNKPHPPSM
jgi:hypothetical protein